MSHEGLSSWPLLPAGSGGLTGLGRQGSPPTTSLQGLAVVTHHVDSMPVSRPAQGEVEAATSKAWTLVSAGSRSLLLTHVLHPIGPTTVPSRSLL